jgi:hypothetical protein
LYQERQTKITAGNLNVASITLSLREGYARESFQCDDCYRAAASF